MRECCRQSLIEAADALEQYRPVRYSNKWYADRLRARASGEHPAEPTDQDWNRMLDVVDGYAVCEAEGHDYQCRRCLIDQETTYQRGGLLGSPPLPAATWSFGTSSTGGLRAR